MTYPVLSDMQRSFLRDYDALNDDPAMAKSNRVTTYLRAKRSWYVIDKQGVIRFKQIGPVTPQVLQEKILPLVAKLNANS